NIKQHTNMQQKKFYFGTHREQYSTVNRVIPLFSQTIFTISVSCSAVKVCVLPPRCGSLSVLQNTNTVSTLYSIDMQYYSTQGKYILVPVLYPKGSNDGSNCEVDEIWLDPLASLPHAQTMVEHMVYHSGPNLIRDDLCSPKYELSTTFTRMLCSLIV